MLLIQGNGFNLVYQTQLLKILFYFVLEKKFFGIGELALILIGLFKFMIL